MLTCELDSQRAETGNELVILFFGPFGRRSRVYDGSHGRKNGLVGPVNIWEEDSLVNGGGGSCLWLNGSVVSLLQPACGLGGPLSPCARFRVRPGESLPFAWI